MTRIILQPGDSTRESLHAWKGSNKLGVEVALTDRIQPYDVPVGDVPFCQSVMARQGIACPKPDFYPTWLSHWMHRMWTIREQSRMYEHNASGKWFVKSADEFKVYPSRILNPGNSWPSTGRFIVSEVVQFVQEWRYYVADGEVIATGWYDGNDEEEPAPELGIDWPAGFCGAVDFGRLSTGELALVESHPPFACGWYGEDPELFVLWLIAGWESLKKNSSILPPVVGS